MERGRGRERGKIQSGGDREEKIQRMCVRERRGDTRGKEKYSSNTQETTRTWM